LSICVGCDADGLKQAAQIGLQAQIVLIQVAGLVGPRIGGWELQGSQYRPDNLIFEHQKAVMALSASGGTV